MKMRRKPSIFRFACAGLFLLPLMFMLALCAFAQESADPDADIGEPAATYVFMTDEIGERFCINTSTGERVIGWLELDGDWYYFGNDGVMRTGWTLSSGGYWYYFEPESGVMRRGWAERNGNTYYLQHNGKILTGWLEQGGDWYYFGNDGVMRTGWALSSGGYWYYFEPDSGVMRRGWAERNGNTYYLQHNGKILTGWLEQDGNWYYFGADGIMSRGWARSSGGYWYYFDPDTGIMQKGWATRDGNTYYMRPEDGKAQSGWREIDGWWYYFGSDGRMRTGWQYLGGKYYYLYKEDDPNGGPVGANAYNTLIDGREVLSDGSATDGSRLHMEDLSCQFYSLTDYLILVDTTACKVGIFRGSYPDWELIKFWDCAPGKPSTPTVKGIFTVQSRGYYFNSEGYRCYYYTQFYGNYLFHSVLYDQSGYNSASHIMDGRLGMQLSHGCVRLDIDNAYWIYRNIPINTKVYVF